MMFNHKVMIVLFLSVCIDSFAFAGDRIRVRSSDEPFDAFAVRDKLLEDHEWQESLRFQQQIKMIEALPLGCVLFQQPFRYYTCGRQFYRPYSSDNRQVFVQIDPVQN